MPPAARFENLDKQVGKKKGLAREYPPSLFANRFKKLAPGRVAEGIDSQTRSR